MIRSPTLINWLNIVYATTRSLITVLERHASDPKAGFQSTRRYEAPPPQPMFRRSISNVGHPPNHPRDATM